MGLVGGGGAVVFPVGVGEVDTGGGVVEVGGGGEEEIGMVGEAGRGGRSSWGVS